MSIEADIRKIPSFSVLTDAQCTELAQVLEPIDLARGDFLFHQDSLADSVYLLSEGHLAAVTEREGKIHKIIGHVSSGEVVGEMGVLTDAPRSVGIVAQRQSSLLKLSRSEFKKLYQRSPEILLPITHTVINRLQKTINLFDDKTIHETIAVLPASSIGDTQPLLKAIAGLTSSMAQKVGVFTAEQLQQTLGHPESETSFIAGIRQLQADYDCILIEVSQTDSMARNICLQEATRIIITSRDTEGDPIRYAPFTKELLTESMYQGIPKNLVYLSEQVVSRSERESMMVPLTEFFTADFHVSVHNEASLRKLIRFMLGQSLGVVLSGGGTLSWAGVGALKALYEKNIQVDAILGVSSGALVAAAYALGTNFERCFVYAKHFLQMYCGFWQFKHQAVPADALINGHYCTHVLQDRLGKTTIEDLRTNFMTMAANLQRGEMVDYQKGLLWEALRAAIALPGVFSPFVNKGEHHVDGIILNNLPVSYMRDYFDNRGRIIAIDLSQSLPGSLPGNEPPLDIGFMASLKRQRQNNKQHRVPNIFHTLGDSLLLSAQAKMAAEAQLADLVIRPDLHAQPKFSHLNAGSLIEMGYQYTLVQLDSLDFRCNIL